jgi:hypothetical protein
MTALCSERNGPRSTKCLSETLNGPLVAEKRLRKLQADYKAASSERERPAIALDFEENMKYARIATNGDRLSGDAPLPVAVFVAENFRHQKGQRPASRSCSSPGSGSSWTSSTASTNSSAS